ncbi:MAG TPA: hypothetical protein VIL20_16250, partial [Sandaracinaceae bacterium]
VPTCARSDFGDDGILRTQGNTANAECMATYPSILNFDAARGDSPTDFAEDVTCVAVLGTGGCGFEQQLEAILKALTPTTAQEWTHPDFVPIGTPGAPAGLDKPFFGMSQPHGNGANNGFVRKDSVLAIIPLTDEEDCSAHDRELFNPTSPTYPTEPNLRCFAHGEQALHPVSRYVNGLLQLRAQPNLLVYAPIVGIPVDLAPGPGERPNYDVLVGDPSVRDPRMIEMIDPSMPTRLVPSCNTSNGIAFPPIRIVRVAQQLEQRGAGVTVQSICQDSFEDALREIIVQIRSALNAACLPRQLNVEADGSVSCDVLAVLRPDMGACEDYGYSPKMDENGQPVVEPGATGPRPVCVIPQIVPSAENRMNREAPSGTGWFYDNYTQEAQDNCFKPDRPTYQRIGFSGTQPPSGAEVRLECFVAVQGGGNESDIQIGTFCDPAPGAVVPDDNPCPNGRAPEGDVALACDPVTRACGVPCEADVDCRNAGLIGYVCDTRPLNVVDPDSDRSEPYNFCVNPTCS